MAAVKRVNVEKGRITDCSAMWFVVAGLLRVGFIMTFVIGLALVEVTLTISAVPPADVYQVAAVDVCLDEIVAWVDGIGYVGSW